MKTEAVDLGISLAGLPLRLVYDSSRKAPRTGSQDLIAYGDRSGLGQLWFTSWHRRLEFVTGLKGATAYRGEGRMVNFTGNGAGVFTAASVETSDRLETAPSGGYYYRDAALRSVESYTAQGQLQQISFSDGRRLQFSYSDASTSASIAPAPGYLIAVQDGYGRTVQLKYTLPSGADPATGGLLSSIASALQTITTHFDYWLNLDQINWVEDAKYRRFTYETDRNVWALTGVFDENQVQVSTFGWDDQGRVVSTERAGGVNKYSVVATTPPQVAVSISYDAPSNTATRSSTWQAPVNPVVTLPNGSTSSLDTTSVAGLPHMTSSSQPAGSGCAASTSYQAYDANGNATQRDDFNGNRVCLGYDLTRNLETARVEGLSTSATCAPLLTAGAALPQGSRKTSTQWHPDWRVAVKVAEPGRITTSVYNGQPDPFNGNVVASCAAGAVLPDNKPIVVLCKKVEQATTDADGRQGFSAALQAGVANRVWQYTYNQNGQVLTAKGPRTDVNDTTTNTYYTDTTVDHTLGDLQQVQNALGQLTKYTKYNAHGQVLQMVDANNVATDYTYDARQRLKTVVVDGQAPTIYDYYPNGLSQQVTQPDGSWVGYEYDDAQRMNAVKDNLGNRIEYKLNNAGQREEEKVKDPGGALRRQLSRVYDALGRVQQTTGRP